MPSILLFIMLTLVGLMGFQAMKIQNFPDIDLPTVTVDGVAAGRVAGAAGDRGRAQDRELDRHAAGRQAHLHQGAGRHGDDHGRVPPREADAGSGRRRARRGLARALRPARRPARPGHPEGRPGRHADPDLHRRVERAWTTRRCRWFVDNTRHQEPCSRCAASARWRASAASTREVRVELDPARLLALNATAADISRQLRQMQQEASGGRTDVGGAEQSVRTIATVQSADELARDGDRADATAGASASTRSRRVSDTVAEQRSAALLNGKPVVGFEIMRIARRRRGRRRRRRARRAREAEGARTPTSASPRPSTSSTRCRRTTTAR